MTDTDDKFNMLQQAAQLTKKMLSLAKQKKWEELDPIEAKRQLLLQTVFPLADDALETQRFSIELQMLIDTNHELIAHCRQGKQALQLQMRDAKFTQKAVTAYQSN